MRIQAVAALRKNHTSSTAKMSPEVGRYLSCWGRKNLPGLHAFPLPRARLAFLLALLSHDGPLDISLF
jgi:hypothetical protein